MEKDTKLCKWCGRTKREHEVPPFEYAILLWEQSVCRRGFEPEK